MSVTVDKVRQVAALARLELNDNAAVAMASDLTRILAHMDALSAVDTEGVQEVSGVGARGTPVRPDEGPSDTMHGTLQSFAPEHRDGLILVPRLASHSTSAQ